MRQALARALLALLLVTAVLVAASPPAAAHHTGTVKGVDESITETVTLPVNNYSGYTVFLGSGETIGYDIHVVSGWNIDVYFVLTGGLLDYANDTAFRIEAYGLFENGRNFTGTFDRATGAVTVIVDNVDLAGAVPIGPVTVAVSLTKKAPVYLAAIALIAVGAGILAVVLVFAALKHRRASGERPPPAPPRPYVGPYAPPPQPPETQGPAPGRPPSPPPANP